MLLATWFPMLGVVPLLPARFATLASVTAIIIASTATATLTAVYFRSCFIDRQCAAAGVLSIQRRDGFFRLGVIGHFNESKPTGAPGIAVGYDGSALYVSEWLKQCTKLRFRHAKSEVADKDLLHFLSFSNTSLGMDCSQAEIGRRLKQRRVYPMRGHSKTQPQ
jgi:hypothetical protein